MVCVRESVEISIESPSQSHDSSSCNVSNRRYARRRFESLSEFIFSLTIPNSHRYNFLHEIASLYRWPILDILVVAWLHWQPLTNCNHCEQSVHEREREPSSTDSTYWYCVSGAPQPMIQTRQYIVDVVGSRLDRVFFCCVVFWYFCVLRSRVLNSVTCSRSRFSVEYSGSGFARRSLGFA